MDKVILIRYGEIMLKGLNRSAFEDRLVSNIKVALKSFGKASIIKMRGRMYVLPEDVEEYNFNGVVQRLTKVFGIVSISVAYKFSSEFEVIKENAINLVKNITYENFFKTFKVETRRENKKFFMTSPEVSKEIGAGILNAVPDLKVDINTPEFILYIEIREFTYMYHDIIPGMGGMPVGTGGKGLLLLSGGIDSPVAGWMMSKRGVTIDAIHFYSYPYTSERAKDKVIELAKLMSSYCGKINLHIVPFTDIQLEINEKCPQAQSTLIMRRYMMRIAQKIAKNVGAEALITGESLGQVASQTMQGLVVTNAVVDMPVFRPLIGMDKNEVVAIARKIGTFDTSILPYEDCCTVFVPKHPETKPKLNKIIQSEEFLLSSDNLIEEAIKGNEVVEI